MHDLSEQGDLRAIERKLLDEVALWQSGRTRVAGSTRTVPKKKGQGGSEIEVEMVRTGRKRMIRA